MKTRRLTSHWLTITPNDKINAIIDKLPSEYDEHNKEYAKDIHTTHITNSCMRQSYFNITSPKPTTAQEAKNFIVGEAQHVILQRLLGPILKAEAEKRILTEIKNGDYVGIVSRIDLLSPDGPIELKTNSSFKRTIKQYYLDQIKLYCAATNKRKAVLIIIWQNAAREIADPRLRQVELNGDEQAGESTLQAARAIEAYDVKFTEQEMQRAKTNIENRFYELTSGLIKKDPAALTAVKHDKILRFKSCTYCKYKQECDEADAPNLRVFGEYASKKKASKK